MDGLRRVLLSQSPERKRKVPRLNEPTDSTQDRHSKARRADSSLRNNREDSRPQDDDCSESEGGDMSYKGESSSVRREFPLSSLPADALLHVFSFLEKNDQLRMSGVCRLWRQLVFTSPRLWRRRHVTLRCSRHSRHSRQACLYARRLGRYLRKLTVACEHPHNHSCRSMAICFRKLLASLKPPTGLTSFKVTDLRLRFTRASVIQDISSLLECFLLSLQCLKTFQMSSAHWPAQEGLRVISAVFAGSTHTLHTLRIDGFFLPRFVPSHATDVLTVGLASLTGLSKLAIDYFYLSEQSVLALASSRRGQLRSLKLVACDVSPHSQFVSKFAWQALTSACPSMRVEICVQGFTVSPARSLPLLLCPALRVNKLRLGIGNQYTFLDMPRLNMAAVLGHVTRHFRKRLTRFEMDVDNHNDTLDAALIRMVRKCRNLVSVKVTAFFISPDTDTVVGNLVKARRQKQSAGAGGGAGGAGHTVGSGNHGGSDGGCTIDGAGSGPRIVADGGRGSGTELRRQGVGDALGTSSGDVGSDHGGGGGGGGGVFSGSNDDGSSSVNRNSDVSGISYEGGSRTCSRIGPASGGSGSGGSGNGRIDGISCSSGSSNLSCSGTSTEPSAAGTSDRRTGIETSTLSTDTARGTSQPFSPRRWSEPSTSGALHSNPAGRSSADRGTVDTGANIPRDRHISTLTGWSPRRSA